MDSAREPVIHRSDDTCMARQDRGGRAVAYVERRSVKVEVEMIENVGGEKKDWVEGVFHVG